MFRIICTLLLCISLSHAHSQTVKFVYENSLIFVPVRINNENLLFLVHTGANTSVIDSRISSKLHLPVVKENDSVTGTAGRQKVALVRIKSLAIGNTVMRDLTVSRREIENFIAANGRRVDGILGTDVLKNYAMTIDFQGKKIAFQSARIPTGRKKTISFDMTEGIPRVEIRLNDTLNTFLHFNSGSKFDPNSDVYVNLSPLQWESLQQKRQRTAIEKNFVGQGVGGNIFLKAVKLDCIALNRRQKIYNGYAILQPREGYFSDEHSIGFFGNNLLEKYGRVSVDFIARQIVLPVSDTKGAIRANRRQQ